MQVPGVRVLETCRPLQTKPSGSGDEKSRILDNHKTSAHAYDRTCEKLFWIFFLFI